MGLCKKNAEDEISDHHQEPKRTAQACITCLWSFLVSLSGGLVLGYWKHEYHHTNTQLWMVPFGLILLVTPVIIWVALSVSEIYNSDGGNSKESQPAIAHCNCTVIDVGYC
ncbi:hypothetical protein MANES_01G241300v8 [Manihot esculenta]|uniref:Uncharacterized protein n=1 Tax=Manihot esculenta TaxID=3983 RepID=A0A2C9WNK3_MANES|nr:hypothetical protein MANES_01G241300v8 [Manihot esculenta]